MAKILEVPAHLRPLLRQLVDVLLAFDRHPQRFPFEGSYGSYNKVFNVVREACERLFLSFPEASIESLPLISRLIRESGGIVIERLVGIALFRVPRKNLAELYVASKDDREHKYFKRALLEVPVPGLKDDRDVKDAGQALSVLYKEEEFSLAAELLKTSALTMDMLIQAAFHTSECVGKTGRERMHKLHAKTLTPQVPRLIQKLSVPANVSFVATLLSKLDTAALASHAATLVPPLIPALAVAPEPVMKLLSKLDTAALTPHAATLVPPLIESYGTHMDRFGDSLANPILHKLDLDAHAPALVNLMWRVRCCPSHAPCRCRESCGVGSWKRIRTPADAVPGLHMLWPRSVDAPVMWKVLSQCRWWVAWSWVAYTPASCVLFLTLPFVCEQRWACVLEQWSICSSNSVLAC